jgi:hypothetical protein
LQQNREDKTLFTGLKGIVQLKKTGVKAGINISTSNNFFCLFCPLGSDREVTGVISVHAQYHCNEPFIAIYEHVLYCVSVHVWGPVRNAFDAGKSIMRASGKGLGPDNHDFFVPCEMASSRQASAIWGPKKLSFPRPNPFPLAQVMDLHASKALRTGPYQSEVHREFYVHELPCVILTGYKAVW